MKTVLLILLALYSSFALALSLSDLIETRDIRIGITKTEIDQSVAAQAKKIDLKGNIDVIDFTTDVQMGPRIEVERSNGRVTRISETSATIFDGKTYSRALTNHLDENGVLVSRSYCKSEVISPDPASLQCLTLTQGLCDRLKNSPEIRGFENKLAECNQFVTAASAVWDGLTKAMSADKAYMAEGKSEAEKIKGLVDRNLGRKPLFSFLGTHWDAVIPDKKLKRAGRDLGIGMRAYGTIVDTLEQCRKLAPHFSSSGRSGAVAPSVAR
ncbi:MAG: hypothetical protein AB7F86_03550 [Bdellovibrionales bacterium]